MKRYILDSLTDTHDHTPATYTIQTLSHVIHTPCTYALHSNLIWSADLLDQSNAQKNVKSNGASCFSLDNTRTIHNTNTCLSRYIYIRNTNITQQPHLIDINVCTCKYIHAYICMYTCIYTYVYIYSIIYTKKYRHKHKYTNILTQCTYLHWYRYTHVYIYIYRYRYRYGYRYIYIYIYVHTYIYLYIIYVYIYIYIYICTYT